MSNAPESTKVVKGWEGNAFSDMLPTKEETANKEVDHKGRIMPKDLTDRELLEEIVTTLRTTQDAMEQIVKTASKNPMFKMLGLGK